MPTPDRIMQMAWGYAATIVVDAAVRHRVFDVLEGAGLALDEVAAATGLSPRGLKALLNALVGLKLLARTGERYELTPESDAFLVASRPGYRGAFFAHHTEQLLPQWMHLPEVLRTGRPVRSTNREAEGSKHFEAFVESLFPGGQPAAEMLARHLNLAAATRSISVLDLGAGSGVWGITLAQHAARVRVLAVDWPGVLEVTRRMAERHGVAGRLATVAGDFLEADLGAGHDVAVLGHILHSEGPERVRRLLRRVWEALAPGGVVAIQEFMPDDDRLGPALPLLFAVNMLVNTEAGDTYTFAEISGWLRDSGFVNVRLLPVPAVSPLVLAERPV